MAMHRAGLDVVVWNPRGCGGEPNRLDSFYHSAQTGDLAAVVDAVSDSYDRIVMIGFSLGGLMTLNYLAGHRGPGVPPASGMDRAVQGAVVYSVPLDLGKVEAEIMRHGKRYYTRRFLRAFRERIELKRAHKPELMTNGAYRRMKRIREFDEAFTVPDFGFSSVEDYYHEASCLERMGQITVPTLLVNARNDPFLPAVCFPEALAEQHKWVYLETPASGGHIGFFRRPGEAIYWSEERAVGFLRDLKILGGIRADESAANAPSP